MKYMFGNRTHKIYLKGKAKDRWHRITWAMWLGSGVGFEHPPSSLLLRPAKFVFVAGEDFTQTSEVKLLHLTSHC